MQASKQASKQEAAKLTTELNDLVTQLDFAQKQADKNWKMAKNYEA